jgi:hypothetical protein
MDEKRVKLDKPVKIDKNLIEPILWLLIRSIVGLEKVGEGKIFLATKNINIVRILTVVLTNTKHRRVSISDNQYKSLRKENSPLCYNINNFSLFKLEPNMFRMHLYEEITTNSIVELIEMLINSRGPFQFANVIKDGLRRLREQR